MAIAAGQIIDVDDVLGRVDTTERTANVGTFTTTETQIDTVTVSLVSGRTYGVWLYGTFQTTVANDSVNAAIREDSTSGTRMTVARVYLPILGVGFGFALYAEYTAGSTGDKTFVGTGQRQSGTGSITAAAAATQKAYIYVDYVRG